MSKKLMIEAKKLIREMDLPEVFKTSLLLLIKNCSHYALVQFVERGKYVKKQDVQLYSMIEMQKELGLTQYQLMRYEKMGAPIFFDGARYVADKSLLKAWIKENIKDKDKDYV